MNDEHDNMEMDRAIQRQLEREGFFEEREAEEKQRQHDEETNEFKAQQRHDPEHQRRQWVREAVSEGEQFLKEGR